MTAAPAGSPHSWTATTRERPPSGMTTRVGSVVTAAIIRWRTPPRSVSGRGAEHAIGEGARLTPRAALALPAHQFPAFLPQRRAGLEVGLEPDRVAPRLDPAGDLGRLDAM